MFQDVVPEGAALLDKYKIGKGHIKQIKADLHDQECTKHLILVFIYEIVVCDSLQPIRGLCKTSYIKPITRLYTGRCLETSNIR